MKTAFVLGGGGRWGAVEVGMLKALDDAGVVPDLVLGTSIGALNGSVIADTPGADGVRRLTNLWESIAGADLFKGGFRRMRNMAALRPAIHDTAEMRALITGVHGTKLIEDLATPFQCVAASIERAAEHWFTEGPIVDALLASAAIPALFPPVRIGDEHFYDGGLVDSVPLSRALRLGAEVVYVLQVGRLESPLRPPRRLHEAALISFEIARRHRFSTLLDDLPEGVEVHVLPSGNPVSFDDRRQLKWRDTSDTTDLIDAAYRATTSYLEGR